MEDLLNAFLEYLSKDQGYSNNTIAAYSNDLGQFIAFLRRQDPHVSRWDQVKQKDVKAYAARLQEKPYASSTVARKVAAIKSFFHHLSDEQLISTDPTVGVSSPKVKKRMPTSLTSRQLRQLVAAPPRDGSAKSLRDRALLILLYATGLRVTEAVTLTQDDVDLANKQLHCKSQDNRPRELPLSEQVSEALRAYLERGRPVLLKDPDESALFLNHRGEQLTRQGLWLIIKVYAKLAGLSPDVTPHTLRHSFAAQQLAEGKDLREVQRLLGHANISTTHIYTQLTTQTDSPD